MNTTRKANEDLYFYSVQDQFALSPVDEIKFTSCGLKNKKNPEKAREETSATDRRTVAVPLDEKGRSCRALHSHKRHVYLAHKLRKKPKKKKTTNAI